MKNLPAMQETQVRYPGLEDPLGVGQWLPTPVLPGKAWRATVPGIRVRNHGERNTSHFLLGPRLCPHVLTPCERQGRTESSALGGLLGGGA